MFNKTVKFVKANQTPILLTGIYILGCGLVFKTIEAAIRKEMFHQVEESLKSLDLTDTVVNHMNDNVY